MRTSSSLRHFGQGLVIGAGELVPAVGAGTMAVILGIYERAIDSIRAGSRLRLREVDWALLVPAGLGALLALGLGAKVVPELIETYPAASQAVLFGLVAGALVVPWRQVGRPGPRAWSLAAAGAVVGGSLAYLPGRDLDQPAIALVLVAGLVVSAAIVLPGISASFILLAFGLYETTLRAIDQRDFAYLAALGVGVLLGLVVLARLVGWLLDHRPAATFAVLTGLMAGSLRLLWPWTAEEGRIAFPPPSARAAALAIALAVAGLLAVRWVVRLEGEPEAQAAITDPP